MKLRLCFKKLYRVILLFDSQFTIESLEKKIKTTYKLDDRYLICYYKDNESSNTMLMITDELTAMRSQSEKSANIEHPQKLPEIRVLLLSDFLAKNSHFAIENILKSYFFEKIRYIRNIESFQFELNFIHQELKEGKVNQRIIRNIIGDLHIKYLQNCHQSKLDITVDQPSELPLFKNDNDTSEISNVIDLTYKSFSFSSQNNDFAVKKNTPKQFVSNALNCILEHSDSENESNFKINTNSIGVVVGKINKHFPLSGSCNSAVEGIQKIGEKRKSQDFTFMGRSKTFQ